jgi:hypothetical protein
VIAIFNPSDSQTNAESSDETTSPSSAVSSAMHPRALISRPSSSPSRTDSVDGAYQDTSRPISVSRAADAFTVRAPRLGNHDL